MEFLPAFLHLLFAGITTVALLVILNLLLPGRVERAREKLEGHYLRSFVLGLVALGLSVAVILLLAFLINAPYFKTRVGDNILAVDLGNFPLPGFLTLLLILGTLALASLCAIGLASLAGSLGKRIEEERPTNHPELVGALLLVLSALTPFLGWFIFAPIAVCTGFGAAVQTLARSKPATQPARPLQE